MKVTCRALKKENEALGQRPIGNDTVSNDDQQSSVVKWCCLTGTVLTHCDNNDGELWEYVDCRR